MVQPQHQTSLSSSTTEQQAGRPTASHHHLLQSRRKRAPDLWVNPTGKDAQEIKSVPQVNRTSPFQIDPLNVYHAKSKQATNSHIQTISELRGAAGRCPNHAVHPLHLSELHKAQDIQSFQILPHFPPGSDLTYKYRGSDSEARHFLHEIIGLKTENKQTQPENTGSLLHPAKKAKGSFSSPHKPYFENFRIDANKNKTVYVPRELKIAKLN